MVFNAEFMWTKFDKTAESRRTLHTHTHTHTHTCSFLLSNYKNCACNFCEKFFKKTKLIFATLVVAVFCAGAYATTDIQPNGNLAGGNTAANCTQPVLGTYSGSTNFEAKWRANEVPLRWYDRDTRITTVQDTAKTCTYDGVLNIPSSAPSRTGYTFGGWTIKFGTPSGYTRLEYLQSSGTQYINTGITVESGVSVEAIIQGTGDAGVVFSFDQDWTGTYVKDNGSAFCAAGQCVGSSANKTLVTTSWSGASGSITQTATIGSTTMNYRCSRSYKVLTFFKGNVWDSDTSFWAGRIYSFVVYKNNVLLRDFIPVKRNSDNVLGMYDLVTNTFFTNAGTGTFIAGPALN